MTKFYSLVVAAALFVPFAYTLMNQTAQFWA